MKFKYIKSLALVCGAVAITSCTENSWNNTFLDDFESGPAYSAPVTVEYLFTKDDYNTLGGMLYNMSQTDEEKAAANSIRNNLFFDESSPYPAETAIPYFLNNEQSNFYIYNNGSKVQIAVAVAQGVPEELTAITKAPRVFFNSPTSESQAVNALNTLYPAAAEGDYAIISYENAAAYTVPAKTSNQKLTYTRTSSSRADEVWTVSEALAQLAGGYTGPGTVKGVITNVKSFNASYGEIDYYIADQPGGEELYVYGGLGLNGEKFTSLDDLSTGVTVVVSGDLKTYNGTPEFNYGSKILSMDGNGNGGNGGAGGGDDNTGDDEPGNDNPSTGELTDNIKNLAVGSSLTATAVVTAQTSRGVILTDNGGSILYYNTGIDLSKYPIGTVVKVSGEVSAYNQGLQLTDQAVITVDGTMSYTYPTPVDYTGAMVDEACATSGDFLAKYISVKGKVVYSGSYINVEISGATAQGSVYYATDAIKAKLTDGLTYNLKGYFMAVSGTGTKYFNIIVTDAEQTTADFNEENGVNIIYVYQDGKWAPAKNATTVETSAYAEMGFDVNKLSEPAKYLPNYMKQAFPYALPNTEMFVAYNFGAGRSCSLLLFDGNNWTVNDNYLENKVGEFVKNNGTYTFRKWIGEEVFLLYNQPQIAMNCGYLIVYGNICANPVPESNSYGYLEITDVEIDTDSNSIIMPNGDNTFMFMTSAEYNGNTYYTPEGTFVILDSNGRYMYCKESYNNFNVRADNPYIENDGSISDQYLFTATLNEDGTWTIKNVHDYNGTPVDRVICYSESATYKDFAAYAEADLETRGAKLPVLYISEETMPDTNGASAE
ncbi:MAG: hypothetical protein J1F12_00460 [Muribaculaceae bacterium]|nr:hypothetical protein [Muribaculaceae bacterium]